MKKISNLMKKISNLASLAWSGILSILNLRSTPPPPPPREQLKDQVEGEINRLANKNPAHSTQLRIAYKKYKQPTRLKKAKKSDTQGISPNQRKKEFVDMLYVVNKTISGSKLSYTLSSTLITLISEETKLDSSSWVKEIAAVKDKLGTLNKDGIQALGGALVSRYAKDDDEYFREIQRVVGRQDYNIIETSTPAAPQNEKLVKVRFPADPTTAENKRKRKGLWDQQTTQIKGATKASPVLILSDWDKTVTSSHMFARVVRPMMAKVHQLLPHQEFEAAYANFSANYAKRPGDDYDKWSQYIKGLQAAKNQMKQALQGPGFTPDMKAQVAAAFDIEMDGFSLEDRFSTVFGDTFSEPNKFSFDKYFTAEDKTSMKNLLLALRDNENAYFAVVSHGVTPLLIKSCLHHLAINKAGIKKDEWSQMEKRLVINDKTVAMQNAKSSKNFHCAYAIEDFERSGASSGISVSNVSVSYADDCEVTQNGTSMTGIQKQQAEIKKNFQLLQDSTSSSLEGPTTPSPAQAAVQQPLTTTLRDRAQGLLYRYQALPANIAFKVESMDSDMFHDFCGGEVMQSGDLMVDGDDEEYPITDALLEQITSNLAKYETDYKNAMDKVHSEMGKLLGEVTGSKIKGVEPSTSKLDCVKIVFTDKDDTLKGWLVDVGKNYRDVVVSSLTRELRIRTVLEAYYNVPGSSGSAVGGPDIPSISGIPQETWSYFDSSKTVRAVPLNTVTMATRLADSSDWDLDKADYQRAFLESLQSINEFQDKSAVCELIKRGLDSKGVEGVQDGTIPTQLKIANRLELLGLGVNFSLKIAGRDKKWDEYPMKGDKLNLPKFLGRLETLVNLREKDQLTEGQFKHAQQRLYGSTQAFNMALPHTEFILTKREAGTLYAFVNQTAPGLLGTVDTTNQIAKIRKALGAIGLVSDSQRIQVEYNGTNGYKLQLPPADQEKLKQIIDKEKLKQIIDNPLPPPLPSAASVVAAKVVNNGWPYGLTEKVQSKTFAYNDLKDSPVQLDIKGLGVHCVFSDLGAYFLTMSMEAPGDPHQTSSLDREVAAKLEGYLKDLLGEPVTLKDMQNMEYKQDAAQLIGFAIRKAFHKKGFYGTERVEELAMTALAAYGGGINPKINGTVDLNLVCHALIESGLCPNAAMTDDGMTIDEKGISKITHHDSVPGGHFTLTLPAEKAKMMGENGKSTEGQGLGFTLVGHKEAQEVYDAESNKNLFEEDGSLKDSVKAFFKQEVENAKAAPPLPPKAHGGASSPC